MHTSFFHCQLAFSQPLFLSTKSVGCESDLDEGGSLFAGRNRLGKALFRCAATRKAGLKLLFLTEIPLLVVTPLSSLRNPPSLLLFLLFCYSGWHSRGAEPTVSAFRSLSLSLSPSLRRSFSSFPASRKRPTATATVTDRSAWWSARGKIPFIPVADYDLGVGRILFSFQSCGLH